ncbi:MAG TPA: ATP-binding cassette domain-containing protein [Natronosporangium sp.]|nr:ATP-binding cassette domain-containing protein [Natronosporangium sp.]
MRGDGVLEAVELRKRYGATVALDGLSLTVPPGSMYGLVGANGAGKTTLMRLVMGVLAPDAGKLRWRGRPLRWADRRRFGYMPEERGLYARMRAGEQIAYFARLHGLSPVRARRVADHWLERLGLADRRNQLVEALSLGNQQRVQLAVALAHDPELLVLDEPFSGLDPLAVDVLAQVLQERAAAGVPVIFSSHQLELVERLCDEVAIIANGRLVAAGEVAALRQREGRAALRVVVADAAPGWEANLPGTLLERVSDREVRIAAADDQAVLRAAARAGRVLHFGVERPSLAEIFREVVA